MSKKKLLLGLVGLLLISATAWVARRYFNPPLAPSKPPDIQQAITRAAIPAPKVPFTDVTTVAGIQFTHFNGAVGKKLLPETMGGGVCVLDFDLDGWQDLVFIGSCPWPGHKEPESGPVGSLQCYRNKGDGTFEDVTATSGLTVPMYGLGACSGDFNGDGYPDLFVTGVGGCKLFKNVAAEGGQRKFHDQTTEAGLTNTEGRWPHDLAAADFLLYREPVEFATTATFLDYNGDGRLDLFVCRYVKWAPAIDLSIDATLTGIGRAYLPPQQFEGSQCVLYENRDGKQFVDVSEASGIKVVEREGTKSDARERPVAKSLGVIICDPDGDGWPDLLVANDTVRNFFFHNVPNASGDRKFEEKGVNSSAAYAEGRARGAMGIDWGEYLPGKHGLVIANFANEPITFLTVQDPKKPRFTDSALAVGLAGPSRFWLKFGTFFFDYDLDGRLDLLVCNGHLEPEISRVQAGQLYAQPPQLFWNTGDQQRLFEPVTPEQSGNDLFHPIVGRGSAFLDYDGDGDLDVVLIENNGKARLLRNDANLGNRFLRLNLIGNGKSSNTSAIGAQVTIKVGDKSFRRDVAGARGYLSQSELPITFGLGTHEKVDEVSVLWPGKAMERQVWTQLKGNTNYTLRQGQPAAEPQTKK